MPTAAVATMTMTMSNCTNVTASAAAVAAPGQAAEDLTIWVKSQYPLSARHYHSAWVKITQQNQLAVDDPCDAYTVTYSVVMTHPPGLQALT